jgi:hypothetical protein
VCLFQLKPFNDSAVGALALSDFIVPVPPFASNVTVTTRTAKVTFNVYVHVPVSPTASESVPETLYVPTPRGPVVFMTPEALTVIAGVGLVVTKVTGPELF